LVNMFCRDRSIGKVANEVAHDGTCAAAIMLRMYLKVCELGRCTARARAEKFDEAR
jgi:hypothetical protein